jgi:hypothetical protein
MNRRLVRFDIRVHRDDYLQSHLTPEYRNEYLLNPDVEWPLSADVFIWPSVFFAWINTWSEFATIEVDVDRHGGDYWLNLAEMRAHYEANKSHAPNAVPIAIELYSEKSLDEDVIQYTESDGLGCGMWLTATTPREVPDGSTLLGYDIGTATRLSGLTNCGYDERELQTLRPAWAPRLNEFGLLKTLDDAIEYRQVSDARVVEHAPFWIWAIWRLPMA